MELPRPALLGQISLRLSAEGRRALYLAQDLTNGRIFVVPKLLALALLRMKHAQTGDATARQAMGDDDAREAYGFLHLVENMRVSDRLTRKPFNPIFASIPLFDVGQFQSGFKGMADWIVSRNYLYIIVIISILSLILGIRNDWSILQVFENVFSIEALLTFGLVAPFLKVIHEFGHVLVATRFNVRVKKAGIYLIGLYPMPFVDCTDADMSAGRKGRIAISSAGIIVDVSIGLLAFIAWHFVDGIYMRTLLGNIFLFSTLNSVLFNANPLIKLDGYYVFVDALGVRNLATRSSGVLRDLWQFVLTAGGKGSVPTMRREWTFLGYAVLSLLYRINVLFIIAMALLPRYLGAGFILLLWGVFVMFGSPLLKDRPKATSAEPTERKTKWLMRSVVLLVLLAALFLVRVPFKTLVPVQLDVATHYSVTMQSPGFVQTAIHNGHVAQGEVLLVLENSVLRQELEILKLEIAAAKRIYETVQGADPAKAAAALERVQSLESRNEILAAQIQGLQNTSKADGLFIPISSPSIGQYFSSGTVIGQLFPDVGSAHLTGPFPERYVTEYQSDLKSAELRLGGLYYPLDPKDTRLQAIISFDAETGKRSFQLKARFGKAPEQIAGQPADIKLVFRNAALWEHVRFWLQGILIKYREAQLLDRNNYLEDEE